MHLLDGKIRLDESFAAVLDCFHIKPDHLCTRQAMEATLQPFSIRQDLRWRDHRWLSMELDKFAQDNPVDLSRHISLCDLSQLLQKWGLDDKIALFSEYAQHNDSGIIVTSDFIQQLLWKSDTPKEIGYWRDTIKHKGERLF